MKSSFHSLISLLSLFCTCQFRRLDSIQFHCSKAHILACWRLETRLFTLCCSNGFFFITTLTGLHGKQHLLLSRIVLRVFTAPLRSNGRGADHTEKSFSIVEACLQPARVYRVLAQQWVYTSHYFSYPRIYYDHHDSTIDGRKL
jgi:hypothetical protein